MVNNIIDSGGNKLPRGKMFIDSNQKQGLSTGSPSFNKQAGGKKRKPRKKNKKQAGGFAVAPILAAALHTGLEKFKPFSKAKRALDENVSPKHKDNILYKLASKIAGVGSAFGYGSGHNRKKR